MSVRIQIASDIHLEFLHLTKLENSIFEDIVSPEAPILVLAGDIGNPSSSVYRRFLSWCSVRWVYVFLTPGNHEYYGKTIEDGDDILSKVCHETGVVFLHNKTFSIPSLNLTFIGTTLWSHIPPESTFEALLYLNDFRKIDGYTIESYNALHEQQKNWLLQALDRADAGHTKIVVTHHAPLLGVTSHPKYRKKINYAFQVDMSSVMRDFGVAVWFFGHTHYSVDLEDRRSGTRVVANQRGYSSESCASRYNVQKFIKVPTKKNLDET